MNHLIIVNGPPRAGKDTAIEFMIRSLKKRKVQCMEFSSIDPIRNVMQTAFGIDVSKKTPEDRLLLSTIGDAVQAHSEFRTNACIENIERFFKPVARGGSSINGAFFLHIREPALIGLIGKRLHERGFKGTITTVYVDRPGAQEAATNDTDTGTAKMRYDWYIANLDTVGYLLDRCEEFVAELKLDN